MHSPTCLHESSQTPLSLLSPNYIVSVLKQTTRKHKHRSVRSICTDLRLSLWCCSLHALEISSALSCRISWNAISPGWNPLKLMDMLLREIPLGMRFYFQRFTFENTKWFSCNCVILKWKEGMGDLRTGLSSPVTKYRQVKTFIYTWNMGENRYYCSALKISSQIDLFGWNGRILFFTIWSKATITFREAPKWERLVLYLRLRCCISAATPIPICTPCFRKEKAEDVNTNEVRGGFPLVLASFMSRQWLHWRLSCPPNLSPSLWCQLAAIPRWCQPGLELKMITFFPVNLTSPPFRLDPGLPYPLHDKQAPVLVFFSSWFLRLPSVFILRALCFFLIKLTMLPLFCSLLPPRALFLITINAGAKTKPNLSLTHIVCKGAVMSEVNR